ncbi:MAG: DUF2442 domain-containing protein [Cytophagales bacterium]|nr:DUF2442 domain-containing protein [Cytophagales bacterium]
MNPRVKAVVPELAYKLRIMFDNNEVKQFDVNPYLDKGVFRQLQDPAQFQTVRPFLGSIEWQGGQDLCPDTLYRQSVSIN